EPRFVRVYEPSGGAASSGAPAMSAKVETAAMSVKRRIDLLKDLISPRCRLPKRSIRQGGLAGLSGVQTFPVIAVVGARTPPASLVLRCCNAAGWTSWCSNSGGSAPHGRPATTPPTCRQGAGPRAFPALAILRP